MANDALENGAGANGSPGSPQWMHEAIERHQDAIRGFVRMLMGPELRALESESDVLQSTIREALQNPDRVDFRGDEAFRSWLYGAVLLKVRNKLRHYRAERRRAGRGEPLDQARDDALRDSYASVLGEVIRNEDTEQIERALDRLGEREREVLARYYFLGLPHRHIAEGLGITEATSKQTLHRAKAGLAVALCRGR